MSDGEALARDSVRTPGEDGFDAWIPATWPAGIYPFLKRSNAPSSDDVVEAYQAWRANERESERNALLRRIEAKLSTPSVPTVVTPSVESPTRPVHSDAADTADPSVPLRSLLIDASVDPPGSPEAEVEPPSTEVDAALAFALREATRAGEWAAVTALANALATRRVQP